jgi:hypothetical protein
MSNNKFKVLCAIQIMRVDKPKITGDEIAFELNNQGLRRVNGKLWNKGTVNHLIANAEKETNIHTKDNKPVINPMKEVVQTISRQEPETINPYQNILISSVEPKPEKTLIEKDFSSDVDLCVEMARKMDIEWKKCLTWKDHITATIKETEHNKQELINAVANKIYFDDNCQDLDETWFYKILGFKTYEEMKAIIIQKKLDCIIQACKNPVIISERKDLALKRCKYHSWWHNYNNYIQSDKWKEKAIKIINRDGNKCICGSTEKLQVHHKSYDRLFNELESDLITLCDTCHVFITNKNKSERQEQKNLPDIEPKKKL